MRHSLALATVEEALDPEQSYNVNINFYKKLYTSSGWILGLKRRLGTPNLAIKSSPTMTAIPMRFIRQLDGRAVSQGLSANLEAVFGAFRANIGASFLDVFTEKTTKKPALFLPKMVGHWAISHLFSTKIPN